MSFAKLSPLTFDTSPYNTAFPNSTKSITNKERKCNSINKTPVRPEDVTINSVRIKTTLTT